jgi:hypothetical protein
MAERYAPTLPGERAHVVDAKTSAITGDELGGVPTSDQARAGIAVFREAVAVTREDWPDASAAR